MNTRAHYTRWERDRLGSLTLVRDTYVPFRLERAPLRRSAVTEYAAGFFVSIAWVSIVCVIALNLMGCASADLSGCDAWDEDGKRYLECGPATLPPEHADEVGNRCYCHGVVSGDECGDQTAWKPGTFCTQADLVCREAQ